MKATQFLHSAIIVSDLEKSREFYGEVLNLPEVDRPLKFPGTWYQLGDYQIHLIVSDRDKETLDNTEKWGRNRHLAFAIDDVETAIQQLRDRGYPVQKSASGRAAFFTKDPDGHIIELGQVHTP